MPVAAVLHGFIYNKDAFAKVGITDVPKTDEEFFADLDKIKKDGTYVPLAMGTPDQWEAATMGYQNIGPNYWHGEDGRNALIDGKEKLTDEDWVAPFKAARQMGAATWATASRRSPTPTARTCSRSAAPPSIRPVRGRSRSSRARRSSRWGPSRRRCRRPATPATCPITPISASA